MGRILRVMGVAEHAPADDERLGAGKGAAEARSDPEEVLARSDLPPRSIRSCPMIRVPAPLWQ
jgi:hypothetical protein